MEAHLWDFICLILCWGYTEQSIQKLASCANTIRINCKTHHIVIMDMNVTSGLDSQLLEDCNAQHQCNVSNNKSECVQVKYWCTLNYEALQIQKSSTKDLSSKLPLISLMNADYEEGEYSDPQNITCQLKLLRNYRDTNMNMTVRIFEISSPTNCTQFCLKVENSKKPPFCTDSRTVFTPYASAYGQGDWKLNLAMTSPVNCTAKVRFWIQLEVPIDDADVLHLSCTARSAENYKLSTEAPLAGGVITAKTDETIPPYVPVSTVIAVVLGTTLFLVALMLTSSRICRNHKVSCPWKTSNEQADGHDYTYIELGGISRNIAENERMGTIVDDNLTNLRETRQRSQSIGHLLEARNIGRELPPLPRQGYSMENLPAMFEEIVPYSQSLPHLLGSILEHDLPPIPIEIEDNNDHMPHSALVHRQPDDDKLSYPGEESDNNAEYLPPKESLDIKDVMSNETIDVPAAITDKDWLDQQEIQNNSDVSDQDNKDQESDEESYNKLPENEYIGLSQETLNDSDTSSRSSTGILYTLLHGAPRAAGIDEGKENVKDDDNASGDDPKISPVPDDDKDEHGYLVLLPGDVPSLQSGRDVQEQAVDASLQKTESYASDDQARAKTEETPRETEDKISTEMPQEHERKGYGKSSADECGQAMSLLEDKDEFGYLVLLPGDLPSLQCTRNFQKHEVDAGFHGGKAETATETLIYSEVPPEYEEKGNVSDTGNA